MFCQLAPLILYTFYKNGWFQAPATVIAVSSLAGDSKVLSIYFMTCFTLSKWTSQISLHRVYYPIGGLYLGDRSECDFLHLVAFATQWQCVTTVSR